MSGVAEPRSCASCRGLSTLFCDACADALCETCAVTLEDLAADFCPRCCRPLFVAWATGPEGKRFEGIAAALKLPEAELRQRRRDTFRRWARDNPDGFTALRLPKSVMMVRVLTPSQRAESEKWVLAHRPAYAVIDGTMIAAGTPIHDQWKLEQLAKSEKK